MNLCDIGYIKALLERHGFRFSKSMGQNFLIEGWVPRDIAAASGAGADKGVVEVGPGIGPLTRELSQLAGKVVSIELDRSLLPILKETLADRDNVEIVPGDVLKTDLRTLASEKLPGLRPIACANLPYNITSPAITAFREAGCFETITVMIQREVARRICAAPGTGDYGAFSLYCQVKAGTELLFDVPPECFIPAPKVTSSVLRLTPRPLPEEIDDEAHFFQVVRASFAQRRKTLLNGLSAAFGRQYTKQQLQDILQGCGLPPDIRGERLGISEFAALSKALRAGI